MTRRTSSRCVSVDRSTLIAQVEQDFEAATQDYEHHNNALKQELPRFFELSTAFITPLFQSFYFLQLQVSPASIASADITGPLHDAREAAGLRRKQVRSARRRGGHVRVADRRRGGAARGAHDHQALRLHGCVVTSRLTPDRASQVDGHAAGLDRHDLLRLGAESVGLRIHLEASAYAPRLSGLSKPPLRSTPPGSAAAAPPPYSAVGASSTAAAAATAGKRAPPPPPAARPKPAAQFCTALYDFECQAEGDLSFNVGDRIEIVQKTASAQDWWTGKLDGRQGSFPGALRLNVRIADRPGNYVQLE